MLHEEEEKEKKKEQLTPEPEQTKLAVPNKPIPMASPDTRRRADMIKVDVSTHIYRTETLIYLTRASWGIARFL